MIGYSKDQFIKYEDINIPADSIAVNRGYGAFDFFGIVNGKPFYYKRHLDRFFKTMRLMRMQIPYSQNSVKEIIDELVNINAINNLYFKLLAYPSIQSEEPEIPCDLYILPVAIEPYSGFDHKNGVKLITKEHQRFLPDAKSTNYLPMLYWQKEIMEAGAVDVLYYSQNEVRETSRGNVFIVKDGLVSTPNLKMLKGITRSIVLDILNDSDISYTESPVTLEMLFGANEVFLTSTTKQVLPVVKIDGKVINDGVPGDITRHLFNGFIQLKKSWNR